ncbi:MAG TPA: fatty acid desaturase [Alphaproteobacteria bacterium]|jgi:omega-6 fatty acid desaturase (delta-12 desaturase)
MEYTQAQPIVRAGQIASSFGGFLATCAAMYAIAGYSSWLAVLLAPLAAGFLVRIFIIQHDCGHGAFFRAKRVNDTLGVLCSLITLAPYAAWKRQHAGHHGIWNNLDRRQSGLDIYSSCLTVAEYHALGPWARRGYRVMRHPLIANLLLPPVVFMLLYRFPFDTPAAWRREKRAVYLTDLALLAICLGLGFAFGFERMAVVQISVMACAAIIGVWLFSVQHRFENTHWARESDWTSDDAALHGSCYLRLPGILRWFTGNIGFHHIHHLNPRIPNYRLAACQKANPALHGTPTLSLGDGLRAWRYTLWDEERQRMVSFAMAHAAGASATVQAAGAA